MTTLKSWTMTIQKPGLTLYIMLSVYIIKYYPYSNTIIKYLLRHMLLYIKYESRKDTVEKQSMLQLTLNLFFEKIF